MISRNSRIIGPKKLCKLVLSFGDEVLSETCVLFPRQIHEFEDRKEYSLVTCCPEVVDFMNQQEKICFTANLNDLDDDILSQIRTMMITMMQDQQFSISKSMMMIFYILLDIHQKGINNGIDDSRDGIVPSFKNEGV